MLDENLPTFVVKPSSENQQSSTIYLGQGGHDLKPEYTLKRPDPRLPGSKNCYAVALYDSYNPDVLFAEVLVSPEWTQPTLSAAEIRQQGGIPPPPVPLVPNHFTIQLYNPDQQVKVTQSTAKWTSSAYWEFEMPEQTFRMPSASALDRSQSDPTASDITPRVNFRWKRDGKLSKSIACYLSGKSTNGKKSKEPDITLAMFKHGKELTIYEPNMHRVDVEDMKGLEVVMILGAIVIRDIFFEANREMFNISGAPPGAIRKNSNNIASVHRRSSSASPAAASGGLQNPPPPARVPTSQIPPPAPAGKQRSNSRPPPADPRTQWEIDAETERLRKIVEREEHERERAVKEEERRIKEMLEMEEKEHTRREAEIAAETERLRRQYGVQLVPPSPHVQFMPAQPPRPSAGTGMQGVGTGQTSSFSSSGQFVPAQRPGNRPVSTAGPSSGSTGPYLQAPGQGSASSSGFFSSLGGGKKVQKKRSVFF